MSQTDRTKHVTHLAISLPWVIYVGCVVYAFIRTDDSFWQMLPSLFMGVFAPFYLSETAVVAFVFIVLMIFTPFMRWRHKYWLLAILQWLYVFLIYFSVMALSSV